MLSPVTKRLTLKYHQNAYKTETEQWSLNEKGAFLSATVPTVGLSFMSLLPLT